MNLAEKYDIKVPRYTSYPTAPHFNGMVDGALYRSWLECLEPTAPLSLYFHIPFCDSMCWFCGCYTKVVRQYQPISDYLAVLHDEIRLVGRTLPARFRARHLHWGGGSPTMLTPDDWTALVAALGAVFDLDADAELAVELDPRDTTEAYVKALARAGVNRVSIGVQDFDAEVQAAINRHQPFAVVERVCRWLRAHGITRINLDLMYGLPHQTEARVQAMVESALRLQPSRVALFGYAHVPWMKSHQKLIDETTLPRAVERLHQIVVATQLLTAAGYQPIGLDHFARADDGLAVARAQGRLRRNFQGYTADDADVLVGFGASSIGALPAGYAQNHAPLKAYAEAIACGTFPIARGAVLDASDRLRREIIEALMCTLEVDLGAVCRRHGVPSSTFDDAIAGLAPLADDGLVVVDDARIVVTETGRPFVRLAAAAFDAYLDRDAARHSRAV